MTTVTLSWQSSSGIDHFEVGISSSQIGIPTVIYATSNSDTEATIIYDEGVYPVAWFFVRGITVLNDATAWSDPIEPEVPPVFTFTPPQPLQYAYANDIRDNLIGFNLPVSFTDTILNKVALGASRYIDRVTGKRFSPQTVTEKYDGTGVSNLVVEHYPILNVNYVQIRDGSGLQILRTYNSDDLALSDYETGRLQLKPVSLDNVSAGWETSAALLYGHIFLRGYRNVEVNYEYGYVEYIQNDDLQLISTVTNGSTGIVGRQYQATHHNWQTNSILIYQNSELVLSSVTVDTDTGIVTIYGGSDDDIIQANYYYSIPADIEVVAAKLAAMSIVSQYAANITGGVTSFKNLDYQETYGAKPYQGLLEQMRSEVDDVLNGYKKFDIYAA